MNADSGWGEAPVAQELQMVANTHGQPAMSAIIDVKGGKKQFERLLHPVNFGVDQTTNKLTTLMAWPGVYICKGSTLFTDALGYTDEDLACVSL